MDNKEKIDFAISSFCVLERQLLECMEYLPFIDANKQSISPKFIPIIMDACSLIDSIFFEMTDNTEKKRMSLKKYSELNEISLKLDNNATLFLTSPIKLLQPFKGWTKEPPIWWNAYNNLKHNRLNNYNYANFTNAVLSLAGLHQLMARNNNFFGGFLKCGWIDTNEVETIENLAFSVHMDSRANIVVESKLFASSGGDNFVIPNKNNELNFDVDYHAIGLSNRIRNLLSEHKDW